MTWLDEIPLEQKEAVDELRRRTIKDCTPKMLEDPVLFYRFLKGCKFDIKNAEAMLREHILWWKENGIETILTDFKCPEVFKKYVPRNIIGYDKEGCPVIYVGIGKVDDNGLLKSCTTADFSKFVSYGMEGDRELLREQRMKTGRMITQCVYIYDSEGLTLQKATNKSAILLVMQCLKIYQNNYPEFAKAVYIINASTYSTILFSVVKLILTSGVISKIQMFGTDGWKEKLLETIDDEVLPAFLGGKRTDPDGDPLCKSFVCHGGKIPEEYFLCSNKTTLKDQDGVNKLVVSRRSSTDVVIPILHPSSVLMWEFETKRRDIRFGINYKSTDQEGEEVIELIPQKRIDSSNGPETGTYVCENTGSYILVFDNSYSWIFSKEIYYKTDVIPPSTE